MGSMMCSCLEERLQGDADDVWMIEDVELRTV